MGNKQNIWRKGRGDNNLTLSPNLIKVDDIHFATHHSITLTNGVLSIPMVLHQHHLINPHTLRTMIIRYLRGRFPYNPQEHSVREIVVVQEPRQSTTGNKMWITPIEIYVRVQTTPTLEELEQIIKDIAELGNDKMCAFVND